MTDLYETYASMTGATEASHDAAVALTAAHFRTTLLPLLDREGLDLRQASILEFGAGWGKNLLALQALGAQRLRGVDISPEQVALGTRLGVPGLGVVAPDVDLVEALAGERFDVLLAVDVLEHLTLERLQGFARAVRALLRPGGLLVVQVPNDRAPLNPIRAADLTHLRAFTGESVLQFLRLCGLSPVSIAGIGFPGRGPVYLVRRLLATWVVGPLLHGLAVVLYGRPDTARIWAPNLLGVGRNEVR